MAKREITVVVAAKNAMMRGLSGASKSLQDFGKKVGSAAKYIATRFLAAAAAVTAIGVKAVRAFGVQQAAEQQARSSFRAYGEEVEANTEKVKAFAAAIQDETGIADENLIARAAKLKMLGVETDALEQATKATVALQSAGMGEEAAIRAVAAARAGNTSMLTRYIPALRTATSEAEKAQIVNDFLTRGYQQQKDQLDTVNGRFNELRGRLGDLWEAIGAAIVQNDGLTSAMARASEKIKEFTAHINEWEASGGVERLIVAFKQFFADVQHGTEMMGNNFKVAFAGISGTVNYLSGILEQFIFKIMREFQNMGKGISLVWEMMKKPSRAAFSAIVQHSKDALKESTDNGIAIAEALMDVDKITDPVKEALVEREALEAKHAARVIELAEQQHAALNRVEKEKTADAEEYAAERIDIAGNAADEEEKGLDRVRGASQKARSALDMLSKMGHEVEELDLTGAGKLSNAVGSAARAISGVRTQAQERDRATRQVDIMQKSVDVQEQIRDYLRGNLEAE